MTWAKLSDDFPDDCARADLSDAAFRTHAEGLCWAMRKEDGGRIRHLDLRRLAETADPGTAAVELVAKGFWSAAPGGWQIEHHMEYQPEPDLLVAKRSNNAARQRRKRRKDAGLDLDAPCRCHGVTTRVTTTVTTRPRRRGGADRHRAGRR